MQSTRHARWRRLATRAFLGGGILGLVVLLGIIALWLSQRRYVYRDVEEVPEAPVAIVFGAAVYPGYRVSPVLADRVAAAADLYHAGKVRKLLLSGDNRFEYYNEPGAMMRYARQLGVPRDAMQPDYAGRRTYDTCYRARQIFQVRRAVLVTQDFHLSRALLTCRQMGLDVVGFSADRRYYQGGMPLWVLREGFALARAVLDLWVLKPTPVLGKPVPIG